LLYTAIILLSPCGVGSFCLGPTNLANSDQNEGQLIIESISDKKIKGSFRTTGFNIYSNDSLNMIKINLGSFEGDIP